MIGDNPTTIRIPKSKTSWTEKAFQEWFNATFENRFELMSCSQDFHTFDFWMLNVGQPDVQPRIIELKAHIGKKGLDRAFVGCDFIKIQKLRNLCIGTKAYVFHLFEDCVLIQDVDTRITQFKKTTWNDQEVLLGLISVHNIDRKFSVGLANLRPQYVQESSKAVSS